MEDREGIKQDNEIQTTVDPGDDESLEYRVSSSMLIETLQDFKEILREDLNPFQYMAMCTIAVWIVNTYADLYKEKEPGVIRFEVSRAAFVVQYLLAALCKKYFDGKNSLGIGPLTCIVGHAIWALNSLVELPDTVHLKDHFSQSVITYNRIVKITQEDCVAITVPVTTSNVVLPDEPPLRSDKERYVGNLKKLLGTKKTDFDLTEWWGLLYSSVYDFGKHFGPGDNPYADDNIVTCLGTVSKLYGKLLEKLLESKEYQGEMLYIM